MTKTQFRSWFDKVLFPIRKGYIKQPITAKIRKKEFDNGWRHYQGSIKAGATDEELKAAVQCK